MHKWGTTIVCWEFRWCLVAGYYEIEAEYCGRIGVKRFGQTISCQHADARNKVTEYKDMASGEI